MSDQGQGWPQARDHRLVSGLGVPRSLRQGVSGVPSGSDVTPGIALHPHEGPASDSLCDARPAPEALGLRATRLPRPVGGPPVPPCLRPASVWEAPCLPRWRPRSLLLWLRPQRPLSVRWHLQAATPSPAGTSARRDRLPPMGTVVRVHPSFLPGPLPGAGLWLPPGMACAPALPCTAMGSTAAPAPGVPPDGPRTHRAPQEAGTPDTGLSGQRAVPS